MIHKHLLARAVYAEKKTPGVYYLTGWNDRAERQECHIVVDTIRNDEIGELFDIAQIVVTYHTPSRYPINWQAWGVTLAYVRCDDINLEMFELDPLRITPDEYAAVVAEAEAQS